MNYILWRVIESLVKLIVSDPSQPFTLQNRVGGWGWRQSKSPLRRHYFSFIVLSDAIGRLSCSILQCHWMNGPICKTNRNVTWNDFIPVLLDSLPRVSQPSFHFFLRTSSPALCFPKYVSLYHMWHRRIGLSEAGNDFFCSYSCVEGDQRSAGYRAIYYPAKLATQLSGQMQSLLIHTITPR